MLDGEGSSPSRCRRGAARAPSSADGSLVDLAAESGSRGTAAFRCRQARVRRLADWRSSLPQHAGSGFPDSVTRKGQSGRARRARPASGMPHPLCDQRGLRGDPGSTPGRRSASWRARTFTAAGQPWGSARRTPIVAASRAWRRRQAAACAVGPVGRLSAGAVGDGLRRNVGAQLEGGTECPALTRPQRADHVAPSAARCPPHTQGRSDEPQCTWRPVAGPQPADRASPRLVTVIRYVTRSPGRAARVWVVLSMSISAGAAWNGHATCSESSATCPAPAPAAVATSTPVSEPPPAIT